ncbi:Fur family transcriptional regulator [Nitrosomonas mobilis]|uniref:Zinc uptake regulation protein ZUR n=1 Tax=Nitrosomonas mobilis TaxID=51642 RepID=A0A1G5SIY2_9PROT|nr:transcriptional repressor [Nitrosomonas mobilis]SCZ87144.1 Zinc uptake regulation protein ZUR [Nitrosomonas mobilis]HNO76340.1 transcriptional repressor [Nitrosomonas mobilis]
MSTSIEQIIQRTMMLCASTGAKLTTKRQHVLLVLLSTPVPLSAYEIAEQYKKRFDEALPVMSVYRIMHFLIQEKLVHKLETANRFIACAHIACDHPHEIPQFLICDRCKMVQEVGIQKHIMKELADSIEHTGFTLASQQLELHGLCKNCREISS